LPSGSARNAAAMPFLKGRSHTPQPSCFSKGKAVFAKTKLFTVVRRALLPSLALAIGASVASSALADEAGQKAKGQTFLGPIEGAPESTLVAVVIDGKNVLGYVCSADDKFNRQHSAWFRGTCSDAGEIAAASPDGAKLAGKRRDEALSASITHDSETLKASLSLEEPGTDVGLWRAESKVKDYDVVVGWIVNRGKGSIQDRFRGRLVLSRRGSPRLVQGLTLGSKNCKLKKANQLAIDVQNVAEDVSEPIEVNGQQVQEVQAADQQPQDEPSKKKPLKKAAKKQ
jgi:hypothetical protein